MNPAVAADLLGRVDLRAGRGRDAADVDDVGALGDHLVHPVHAPRPRPRSARAVERVGRAVDDRHDQQLSGRERAAAQPQQPWLARPARRSPGAARPSPSLTGRPLARRAPAAAVGSQPRRPRRARTGAALGLGGPAGWPGAGRRSATTSSSAAITARSWLAWCRCAAAAQVDLGDRVQAVPRRGVDQRRPARRRSRPGPAATPSARGGPPTPRPAAGRRRPAPATTGSAAGGRPAR